MPTPNTDAELSLINDAQFLEELEQTDRAIGGPSERTGEARPLYSDAFSALESGLPVNGGERDRNALDYVDEPAEAPFEPYDDPLPAAPAPEPGISIVTAAIVIAACLTVGAATAAYVFQDSLTRITATRTAIR